MYSPKNVTGKCLRILSLTHPIAPEDQLRYYSHMAINDTTTSANDIVESLTLNLSTSTTRIPATFHGMSFYPNEPHHPCQAHRSHSILPAAVSVLTARSPLSSHNLRKQYHGSLIHHAHYRPT